jgi:sec-independent protein translocase protein TatA
MAWDDPIVWILIAAIVVFLFGASKIPQFARSIGAARREFEQAWKGTSPPATGMQAQPMPVQATPPPAPATTQAFGADDPIIVAARNEGIVTEGKTRQQIASDLAWKLKQKEST